MTSDDCRAAITEAVAQAAAARRAVYITAGGSKRDWQGRHCDAEPLAIGAHRGVVDYQPRELVVTARAGTPLAELDAVLTAEGQCLPCEPPQCGGAATLGGSVAGNLSGPARPFHGALRDLVLGVSLVNGRGEYLRFGGRVMKNVAGYDVARLQAGALGTLGVLCDISLKVLPRPESTLTLAYALPAGAAVAVMNRRAGESAPLTGAMWTQGRLYLRLAGAAAAVADCARRWGGESVAGADVLWRDLRELAMPALAGPAPLWRLAVRSTAPPDAHPPAAVIDWCGGLRWLAGEWPADAVHTAAAACGGHALLFRGGDRGSDLRAPPPLPLQRLQRRLKLAFDPHGVLNPGRLYSWL